MSMEERILAERCKARDNDARRELYTRFGGRLLGICLRYVGDRATAEDLLHDCFIKVFAAIDRFSWRGEGSLRRKCGNGHDSRRGNEHWRLCFCA